MGRHDLKTDHDWKACLKKNLVQWWVRVEKESVEMESVVVMGKKFRIRKTMFIKMTFLEIKILLEEECTSMSKKYL